MNKYSFSFLLLFLLSATVPLFGQQFQVLVYTSPDRWHDPTVPVAMNEFGEMAKKHDFGLSWAQENGNSETTDAFTDDYLRKFDVIVFLHSRGYELSDQQMESFKRFIRNGGGFVGIHAPSASKDQEEWFHKLIGRVFTDHPEEQTAVLNVQDKNFPATMHLPDKWIWTDEWYSFGEALTDKQKVLLTVDERTYDPDRTWGDDNRFTAMGDFHPISWYQEYDGGRSFYTSLGHIPASYKDQWFLDHIYGGIYWAATGLGVTE
jgi:type 1 glutamine amidotransferase